MATEAQILANRSNAQKSTGPRTAEGKASAAQNATKHGLFSQGKVVIGENQADFDALREETLKELEPVGVMETILAERIVSLVWRLKRAQRMQDEAIDVKIRLEIKGSEPHLSESLITSKALSAEGGSKNPNRCCDDLALGLICRSDFAEERVLERLSLYERRFEASLFKTMAEYEKLRQARKAKEAGRIENAGIENVPDTNVRDTFSGRRVEKRSQSATEQEELSDFEKREYALLLGMAPTPNEANDSPAAAGPDFRGQKTANGPQRGAFPIKRYVTGVCRY